MPRTRARSGPKPLYGEKMIRRTYQLTPEHDRLLKAMADELNLSEAAALRIIIADAARRLRDDKVLFGVVID